MLAPDFVAEINQAAPADNVTGILNWHLPTQALTRPEAVIRAKQPILEQLSHINGVRINPLPGFPQVIVVAPAHVWRSFLGHGSFLSKTDEIEVLSNRHTFSIDR